MKKLMCLLCALLLAMMPAALAEEETTAEENWYELSADDTVMTVRLPSNELSGLAWEYEISAPESMELITEETIVGEDQGVGGTPTTFVASFRAIGSEGDHVSLIFRLTAEGEEAPAMTYILETILSKRFGGHTTSDELGLPVTESGLVLPCGATGRWVKHEA